MCYLWSDVPLTASLWSQLACCSSPLWWFSRRVIQDCGCSAEIFCPGFYREFAGEEEQWQFLQWRLPISSLRAARKEPGAIAALWRHMELYRSGGVYLSGSLGVDLGLWLRDKQHELGIQMQWACWERAIGEKFEDWGAAAGGVCNPPFLVATLPSSSTNQTLFQAEGLIVCAPRHPLMAELAHHVIHPATSGAGVGRSPRALAG